MRNYLLTLFLFFSTFSFGFFNEGTSEFNFFASDYAWVSETRKNTLELFGGLHRANKFIIKRGNFSEEKELNDSSLTGIRISSIEENIGAELTFAHTKSDTTDGDNFHIYYFDWNFIFPFGDRAFSPFFTIGIGTTTLTYPYYDDIVSKVRFSFNGGIGFKIYIAEWFTLKTDIRSHVANSNKDKDDGWWKWKGGLITTEISFGLVFKWD